MSLERFHGDAGEMRWPRISFPCAKEFLDKLALQAHKRIPVVRNQQKLGSRSHQEGLWTNQNLQSFWITNLYMPLYDTNNVRSIIQQRLQYYFVTSLWSGWVIDHATRTDDSLWRPFALMQPCHFWQKANVLLAHRQACSSGKVCRAKLLLLLLWRCWCDAGLCICNLQGNIYWNISNILNQIELEKSFTWIWWDLPAPLHQVPWVKWVMWPPSWNRV